MMIDERGICNSSFRIHRFFFILLDFRLFYIFTMSSAENFPNLKKTWHLSADFIYNRFTQEKGLKLNFYV